MNAQNIFDIAIHLPEKEMEKLLDMLHKKVNTISISKSKKSEVRIEGRNRRTTFILIAHPVDA